MAVGSISMLGITGSGQSALNSDLIEKLREADKGVMLKPLETQLTKVYKKQDDSATLSTKVDAFRDAVAAFSSDSSYLKRSVTVSNDSVKVTALDAAALQNFSIKVNQLAQNSVAQLKGSFATENSSLNLASAGKFTITQNGQTVDIDVDASTTIADLREAINNASGGKFTASILNTGASDPYTLVIKSTDTGKNQELEFSFTDGSGNKLDNSDPSNPLIFDSIQDAKDAEFDYNGIAITRSTNTVKDLIGSLTIELNSANTTAANVAITRDQATLGDQMKGFVDSYNELMTFLNEITKYDTETGAAGSFQGDSRVNGLKSEINKILFGKLDNGKSLMDISRESMQLDGTKTAAFAFNLSDKGVLSFDQRTFEYALENDPLGIEALLRGTTNVTPSQMVGTQVTTIPASLNPGDIIINGVAIGAISLDNTKTVEENLLIALEEINKQTANTGVTARLGANKDRIILGNESGMTFSVSGMHSSLLGITNGVYSGQADSTNGIFSLLDSYAEKVGGFLQESVISSIDTGLRSDVTNLTKSIQKVLDRLNAKYDVMAAQFSAYNAIISRYESSFSSVQALIDQASAKQS